MKKFGKMCSIFLLSAVMFFIVSACGGEIYNAEEGLDDEGSAAEDAGENNEEAEGESNAKEEEPKEEEKIMDPEKATNRFVNTEVEEDQDISNWIDNVKVDGGVFSYPEDDKIYLIAAGERNTGGYSVVITEEMLEGDRLTLYYKIQSPGPDDMVTQAITYPYLLIEIEENIEEVDFIKQ